MAQGALKKNKKVTATAQRESRANARTRPGVKQIAPKKAALVKQAKLTKRLTSGLVGRTERSLAQKAGHLELLAGGKKDRGGKK
ncbi:UPF0390 protein [Penicillium atrosanguineum]|uniref:UPF0390 protein n=1 Tax=Penicillium atrosanguineum TaxID=1132637 RepID=A0A9W9PXB5_9EURO|nr:uncharacterized protein N7443_002128 [Penicillium atrosanguineum]KAJ5122023.1 UPF0390 protein [Penicillium atrosanguineum]KAJ5139745.1 UPF0390 protein [Penicillium atrosanguineum]KAJ5309667.1 hypothetical protein N7443_002128 [Penicillium atrosanguineum]KAJ5315189.1 UPF0390 protein [Penicillium atrosanguineum]